jgi:SAM-dependent methyltransferase
VNRRAPYDLIAAQWSSARNLSSFREKRYVDLFLASLPGGGRVVDLGCGMGKPIAEYLLSRGCRVVGIDASLEMLRIARGPIAPLPNSFRPRSSRWISATNMTESSQCQVESFDRTQDKFLAASPSRRVKKNRFFGGASEVSFS